MANINFSFNNVDFSVDESALSTATDNLKTHLETVMSGSGAKINLGGAAYNIDSAKLSAASNDFIAHLGTIAGSGSKVVVNGTEYGIDHAKVAGAISDLHTAFGNIGTSTPSPGPVLEGDGGEYYILAPTALTFRSTEPLAEFQEVKVNGEVVDPSNYTLEEGSTIVTLSIDYLKTLGVGNYDIEVVSANNASKGGFTVAAPELNEHGFYYSQSYCAYTTNYGDLVLFLHPDGTISILIPSISYTTEGTYVVDGNNIRVVGSSFNNMPLVISSDGREMRCTSSDWTFTIGNENYVVDEDYMYFYHEDLGGYEVKALDKNKAEYHAIKSGIYGRPTVMISHSSFSNNKNLLIAPKIPYGVTTIGRYAFSWCRAMKSIEIPDSVIVIEKSAFSYCEMTDVYYTGTQEQWSAITIESDNSALNNATIHYNHIG